MDIVSFILDQRYLLCLYVFCSCCKCLQYELNVSLFSLSHSFFLFHYIDHYCCCCGQPLLSCFQRESQLTHRLCRQSVPTCVQQRNHFDRVCPQVQDRHGGVQLGACEEVSSVMFLYVTKGTERCCVVCSVDFVQV